MMQTLFVVGLVLAVVFSVSVALYLVQYTFQVRQPLLKGVALMATGFVTFVVTAALGVVVVWPPHLPL